MGRPLRIAAAVEALSLLVLLLNLATAHIDAVASLAGPIHGCAYLVVIIAAVRLPGLPRTARLRSLVPGIGGLLLLRAHRSSPDAHPTTTAERRRPDPAARHGRHPAG